MPLIHQTSTEWLILCQTLSEVVEGESSPQVTGTLPTAFPEEG